MFERITMLLNLRHIPGPPLSRYIENLWLVQGTLAARWRNLIFPDGAMELILNLGDPQKLCDPDNPSSYTIFQRSWISGERSESIAIEEAGVIHLIGVRFKPGGAYPFFRFPISELTGRVVELDAIWGSAIDLLREDLAAAPDAPALFSRLETWLQQRLAAEAERGRSIAFAVEQIQRGGEHARIGRITEQLGISPKHLVREFERRVGLTPKLLARVCAFQTAVAWIGFKPEMDWADAAVGCGYYDQAHFIHEFRAFAGMTPAVYLKRRGPFLNYVPLD
ncbi:putative Transcriptional regulator, AraC family [Verrucomicrobia bacterium]|nr:putative Transcriptional regulator, AraC family [Verrucomicrobiota bacterium]